MSCRSPPSVPSHHPPPRRPKASHPGSSRSTEGGGLGVGTAISGLAVRSDQGWSGSAVRFSSHTGPGQILPHPATAHSRAAPAITPG